MFFTVGVALWTYYQSGGADGVRALPPGTKPDAVLAVFIMGIFMGRVNGFGATCGLIANCVVCFGLDLP